MLQITEKQIRLVARSRAILTIFLSLVVFATVT